MVQFFARQTRPYLPNYKILRETFEEKLLPVCWIIREVTLPYFLNIRNVPWT